MGELAYISQALDFGAYALEFWNCSATCSTVWAHFDGEVALQLQEWQEQIERQEPIIWLNKPTEPFSANSCKLYQNALSHVNIDNDFIQHMGLNMLALKQQGVIALLMRYPESVDWFTDAVIVTHSEIS